MAPWWLRNDEDLKDEPNGDAPQGGPQRSSQSLESADSAVSPEAGAQSATSNGELDGAGDDAQKETKPRKRRRRRRRSPREGELRSDNDSQRQPQDADSKGDELSPKTGDDPREVSSKTQSKAPEEAEEAKRTAKATPKKPRTSPKRSRASDEEAWTTQDESASQPSRDTDIIESMSPGMLYVSDRNETGEERKIAMFVDFENIALGVRDSEVKNLEVALILERLLEKGKIVVKRAYADWERYKDYKRPLHEAAIELIDIPQKYYSGKNSADIKMVVDAMDLCYAKEHLDTFVLLSGDSDFSPLVSKLKENDKYVIGIGVKNSSSSLLIDNCDEFLYYEDIWRDSLRAPRLDHLPSKQAECFQLLAEAVVALLRENKDVLWGSLTKQTMKRKRPSFNEGYYGYSTFSELLEDAQKNDVVRLRRDRRSGSYIVTGFATRQR